MILKRLVGLVNRVFNKDNIFCHEADGEPCSVCGKPMKTKQHITLVRSGEKMHSKCWGKFFESRVAAITKRERGELDA